MSGLSVGIFYFSGTGNTEIVANLLAQEFERQGCRVEINFINKALMEQGQLGIENHDLVGIGYPIHAFNAPRIVLEFIKRLPAAHGQHTFIFKDSGDPMGNGGATSMVRKKLQRKGYNVFHEELYVMAANVFVKYDDRLVKQLYNKAVAKAQVTVAEILSGHRKLQRNSLFWRALTWTFSTMESRGTQFFGKHLRASEACTLCEKCVRECPMGNISIVDGGVRFGRDCTLCMRCIYRCPVGAISPRYMGFFVIKEGYDIQKVIADPGIEGDFVSATTEGYFASFRKYLES